MYTRIITIFILVFNLTGGTLRSQELLSHRLYDTTPRLAVKTNLLYDVTQGFNLGVEARLSKYLTLDVPVNYNPFTLKDNRKWKHILVQPELRYWLSESFAGHFLGVHAQYANYNVGNIGPQRAPLSRMASRRRHIVGISLPAFSPMVSGNHRWLWIRLPGLRPVRLSQVWHLSG